jgi:hypothetical protein
MRDAQCGTERTHEPLRMNRSRTTQIAQDGTAPHRRCDRGCVEAGVIPAVCLDDLVLLVEVDGVTLVLSRVLPTTEHSQHDESHHTAK